MVAKMAILSAVYWACILASFILPFFEIGIYIVPFVLIFMLSLTVISIPLNIAWDKGTYGFMLLKCIVNILLSILIYSIFYWKSGLVIDGFLTDVDISTAIYFSGTTWTTVGYGDISAPENIRLLTTLEAINGYLAMAILMALIILWIDDALKDARKYKKWISSASKEDIEKVTGISISDLFNKAKKRDEKL